MIIKRAFSKTPVEEIDLQKVALRKEKGKWDTLWKENDYRKTYYLMNTITITNIYWSTNIRAPTLLLMLLPIQPLCYEKERTPNAPKRTDSTPHWEKGLKIQIKTINMDCHSHDGACWIFFSKVFTAAAIAPVASTPRRPAAIRLIIGWH